MAAVERYQQKAAERLSEDEAWRGDLEDDQATRLLDWAIAQTDAAIARVAAKDLDADLSDLAYTVADQARAVLCAVADGLHPDDPPPGAETLETLLQPPLCPSPEEGMTTLRPVLNALGVRSGGAARAEGAGDKSALAEAPGAPGAPGAPERSAPPSPGAADGKPDCAGELEA